MKECKIDQSKVNSKSERIAKWYDHFRNLIGYEKYMPKFQNY